MNIYDAWYSYTNNISVIAFFPLLSANLSVISTTSATRKNLHWSTSVKSGEAYPKQITFLNPKKPQKQGSTAVTIL